MIISVERSKVMALVALSWGAERTNYACHGLNKELVSQK